MTDDQSRLRELPAVDRLLQEPALEHVLQRMPRSIVLQAVRETITRYRNLLLSQHCGEESTYKVDLSPDILAGEAASLAEKRAGSNLKPVINATGVVIHTNLGRAPLARAATEALTAVASGYSNLELSLDSGKRGSRQDHLEALLCLLTGAEAALVVNNNAAAVFLALYATTRDREVVVSRGQLVEIGGSFRIPEIMAAGGARLVEVGTTNKTYLRDYEAVINDNTAALLKVHTSNYHMIGFTAEVQTAELASLAHRHNLILIEDLGSGVLIDLEKFSLPAEPLVQESIAAGADLVTFSGDKMLGGPQAGIIAGRKDLVAAIRANQLARTVRVDKFTIAALEATLRLYFDEAEARDQIPVWRMISLAKEKISERAQRLIERLAPHFGKAQVGMSEGVSRVGGGALPMAELPTCLVHVHLERWGLSSEKILEKLRRGDPPVIVRLQHDTLFLDLRTVFEEQDEALAGALIKTITDGKGER